MYKFEQLMMPIWNTEIIYDESLTMVRKDGKAEAALLFEPKEILSVTSADKTEEYKECTDWEFCDGKFCLTKGSRIFAFEEEELINEDCTKLLDYRETLDGRYSLFQEDHFFHDRQIAVTYRKAGGSLPCAPLFCGELLPRTMKKLHSGERLRIVTFGDSIAQGSNSSGTTLTTPFLPTWSDLLAEQLRRTYKVAVRMINTAIGGQNSYWGAENARDRVGEHDPDLAIIAFGMNDREEPEKFIQNMQLIIERTKERSPITEFILCATTIPNPNLKGYRVYQDQYGDALKEMEEMGVAIADFGGVQKCLLERKRFIDMTGNNVNHPNDFLIRCHAQLLAMMLIR